MAVNLRNFTGLGCWANDVKVVDAFLPILSATKVYSKESSFSSIFIEASENDCVITGNIVRDKM